MRDITEIIGQYSNHLEILRQELLRPSVLFQQRLDIAKDGNQYRVLLGTNLQDGIAGFGTTLAQAMLDFDKNYQGESA